MVCVDVPCAECAYDLRGLGWDGKCPECGTPVVSSLGCDLLRFASPTWLKRVADGTRIDGLTVLATFGAPAVAILGGFVNPGGGPTGTVILLGIFVPAMAMIIELFAIITLTAPTVSRGGDTEGGYAQLTRHLLTAVVVLFILMLATSGMSAPVVPVLFVFQLFLITAMHYAKLSHLIGLLDRIPARNATRRVRWFRVVATPLMVLALIAIVGGSIAIGNSSIAQRLADVALPVVISTFLGVPLAYGVIELVVAQILSRETGVAEGIDSSRWK